MDQEVFGQPTNFWPSKNKKLACYFRGHGKAKKSSTFALRVHQKQRGKGPQCDDDDDNGKGGLNHLIWKSDTNILINKSQ